MAAAVSALVSREAQLANAMREASEVVLGASGVMSVTGSGPQIVRTQTEEQSLPQHYLMFTQVFKVRVTLTKSLQ